MKNMANKVYRQGDRIFRILDEEEKKILVIDSVKKGMPKWINISELENSVEISEEEFERSMKKEIPKESTLSSKKIMHKRFTMISGILPYVGDKRKRSLRIAEAAEKYKVSQNTIRKHLVLYLAFQDISVLAPKEKKEKKDLSQDEKNMRWALNKFYYTKEKQSLATVLRKKWY